MCDKHIAYKSYHKRYPAIQGCLITWLKFPKGTHLSYCSSQCFHLIFSKSDLIRKKVAMELHKKYNIPIQ